MQARHIIDSIIANERVPPRMNLDPDQELEMAVKQPFTAYDLALRRGQHHPQLWDKIKGSPFERDYRRRFRVGEGEDPKAFLKHDAPPTQFEVEGTWQSWVSDGMGNVLYDLEARHTARWKVISIKKFNVEEYHQRTGQWPRGQVHLNQISYWDHRGRYYTCAPETRRPHQEIP